MPRLAVLLLLSSLGAAGCLNRFDDGLSPEPCASCRWRSVAATATGSYVVASDGATSAWGHNNRGALGVGDRAEPTSAAPLGVDGCFVSIDANGFPANGHACAVACDGSLWCWGENGAGELGLGEGSAATVNVPTRVDERVWLTVSCGELVTCALVEDDGAGQLHCTGFYTHGRRGFPTEAGGTSVLTAVPTSERFIALSMGEAHGCALTADHELWCWGRFENGQRDGATDEAPAFVHPGVRYRSVDAGQNHTCGVRTDGSLWCWGDDASGQLGATGVTSTRVGDASDWRLVSAGATHTCGIREDGSLWCWGAAELCGVGPGATGVLPPTSVPSPGAPWSLVAAGPTHTCATTEASEVYCWGERVLNGQSTEVRAPTLVVVP